MPLAPPIQLRLDRIKLAAYEKEASERNLSLVEFLRLRLDDPERLAAEIAELRGMLKTFIERTEGETDAVPNNDAGVLLEILLLLRAKAKPDELRMWQAEVQRQGFRVWSGE